MLEPLFQLLDDGIDTNLLRLFFEDKKMPRIARKFDLMNTVLSRAEFIEVLSSPELLDFDGYEDEQSSLFTDQPPSENENGNADSQPVALKDKDESVHQTEDAELQELQPEEQQETSDETEEVEDKEDDSLNTVFEDEIEEEEEQEITSESQQSAEDRDDEEKEKKNDFEKIGDEQQEDSSPDKNISSTEVKEESEKDDENNSGSEEATPMWMRYMSEEEIEEYKKEYGAEEDEKVDEDGFIDEPIIDLTKEDASDEEIKNLRDMLSDEEELFVEEIFRGSDRAFDQAIEDIAAYDSWRDVSKYIEKDIFKRNLVDMYSETAVDFTDRLQSYFLEKQNRNKQEN